MHVPYYFLYKTCPRIEIVKDWNENEVYLKNYTSQLKWLAFITGKDTCQEK